MTRKLIALLVLIVFGLAVFSVELIVGMDSPPYSGANGFEAVADLAIINAQSYPTVGGNWTVMFNTTGTGNLTITAVNGTTWSREDGGNDLKFLGVRCGNSVQDHQWVNNSAFMENYSCNETSYETGKVLTAGAHTLEFRFGGDVEYAYNQADWDSCRTEGWTTTIPASSSSADLTLATAITDMSQAFLLVDSSGTSGVQSADGHMVSGYVLDANTLRFQRGAAPATAAQVSYTLVECFDNQFSVQRGEITVASSASSNTASISSVDTAKSIVIISTRSSDSNSNDQTSMVTGELLDATTVSVNRSGTYTPTATVRYEVVTFSTGSEVTVQTGEVTLASGAGNVTDTLSTNVNMSSSWLYCSWDATYNGLQQTAVGCQLSATNEVTFYRYASSAYINRVRYYVIEFPSGSVAVQRGNSSDAADSSDDTQYDHDISISAVGATTAAFPFVTNTVSGVGTSFPRNRWIESLTSTTNLRVTFWRGDGGGSTYADNVKYWQVIEFIDKIPTVTIDNPLNTTIPDNTPDLDFTIDGSSNVTYSWNSEGNISGCRKCRYFNTTYGENNGSDTKLNMLLHFNENFSNATYDDSGTSNDGTLGNATVGTQPAWTTGKFGHAMEFDGNDDFVNISDSSSLDFTENLTIAAWVYPKFTSWPGYTGAIGKNSTYALGMGGGKLRLSLYNGTKWSTVNSPDNVSLNQWVHIAGTFNGSWMRLYVNGAEVTSQAVSASWGNSIVTSAYPLQVGHYTGQPYFEGTIDEVAIYNRSLSGTEVQELYGKSLEDDTHCVTVYANDSTGTLNSTKKCFTVNAFPAITIAAPTGATINDSTPDLNFTISETSNVTYSWDSEGNISGCRNCVSYNTTYGENDGSDTKLNALFHFNENFSETAFDASTRGNDGTLGNATAGTQPAWTTGKFGHAMEFDGSDDFVNVSDSSSLDFTENLTIAAWVYPKFTSWPSPYTGAVGKNYTYALGVGNGKLRLSMYNGSKWSAINSPDNVSFNRWVHIAGTFNGSWMRLYINGAEVKSQAVSTSWGNNIVTSAYPLQVGYYTGYTYFNGTIDEVAIYNRSLSGAEIQEMYSKSLPNGYHCVTVQANDTTGNFNSTKRCFTVSVSVPTKLLAGTNRFSVWAPYTNVINYESDESSFKFRAGGLVIDQNGVALAGENVTFKVYSGDSTLKATITNTTGANGIAYMVYNTKGDFTASGDGDYGTWQMVAMVTDDTSINTTKNLQIDRLGHATYYPSSCSRDLCHHNPSNLNGGNSNDVSPKSPYSDKFGISGTDYLMAAGGHLGSGNHDNYGCEFCHSGYGKSSAAPATSYPWGAHTNIACTDSNCHGTSVYTSFPPNMPSCYDCHPKNNTNLSTVDTTVTVNSITGATVYSWNHEQKAPLMAHTTDQTYDMSEGIPCWICHGPMHNITKPDPVSANTNTYTEASQCTTCHSPKAEHNNAVNCTTCHSQDAHNISFFNTTGNYIKSSGSAGDCTTCHQQTTAWNTLLTQPKVGTYSGSGPPQVPTQIKHSDNATGQRWGSYWTTGNELSACNYCHGDTKHSATALGRPANWSGSNTVNSSINATNNWCAGCHYQLYSSGSDSYSDMPSVFTGDGLSVPPEITRNSSYAPTGTAGYFNHSLGDYSDKTCSYCHDGLASSATNITAFVHSVGTGKRCENCHFSSSKMDGTFSKATAYMNETRFTKSVHGTSSVFPSVIFCTSCHTSISNGTDYHLSIDPSVFTPPQSGWKWCEDCHVVNQTAPASNRHNLTDNPATNMFNSTSSVMDVTDCTTCHNATMYDSSKATYNKTSGKDCRFCHTFPDLRPGGD